MLANSLDRRALKACSPAVLKVATIILPLFANLLQGRFTGGCARDGIVAARTVITGFFACPGSGNSARRLLVARR